MRYSVGSNYQFPFPKGYSVNNTTQVLPAITEDEFDEFIDDSDTEWDEPEDKANTTTLLAVIAAALVGVLVLTYVLMNQMVAALPQPTAPRGTVTATEVSTRQVTSVQTATQTVTETWGRDRGGETGGDSRVVGGAGGQSGRARPAPTQPESGNKPVEVTSPAPSPAHDAAGSLARSFGDGVVMAGRDVVEGTYRNSGSHGGTCEWTFRRGNQVIDSGRTVQSFKIDLVADGVVFISRGCGTWTLQG